MPDDRAYVPPDDAASVVALAAAVVPYDNTWPWGVVAPDLGVLAYWQNIGPPAWDGWEQTWGA
jgi:hypothetical protein